MNETTTAAVEAVASIGQTELVIYIVGGMFILLLLTLLIANLRLVSFGMELLLKRIIYKGNMGLVFIKNKSHNFSLPKIVSLAATSVMFKNGKEREEYPLTSDMFTKNGRFFNLPYVMFADEDAKTTLGLMYQKCDAEGNPMFHTVLSGIEKNEKDEEVPKWAQVPMYEAEKNSISVSPTMMRAIIDERAFGEALKSFLAQNQIIMWAAFGAIIAAGISAYFGYEMIGNLMPAMETQLAGITQKLDAILVAVVK